MDQFGVLVESIGFKAHGKSSAPLADLKGTNKTNDNINGFEADFSSFNRSKSAYNSHSSLNVDDLDGIFRSNSGNNRKPPNTGFDDVFGGGVNDVDLDSVFRVPNSNDHYDDDIFGLKKKNGSGSINHGDVFGSKGSTMKKAVSIDDMFGNSGGLRMKSSVSRNSSAGEKQNVPKADDLLGSFGRMEMKKKLVKKQDIAPETDDLLGNFSGMEMKDSLKKKPVKQQDAAPETDDLLSGFAVKSPSSIGMKTKTTSSHQPSRHSAKSSSASAEDPFVMFDRANGRSKANNGASGVDDYLDSFFSPSSTRRSQGSTSEDSIYDSLFSSSAGPKVEKVTSESSYGTKRSTTMTNSGDDYSYLFGLGDAPSSGEFQEIKGESEERRRARLNHHMMTQERMAKALNEKNQRDLQAQQEHEEKQRIAATLDGDIKRWAVGKEGNLRALLSSLQYVLWPEAGWQPVSLTDLITSTSVKKTYYKATLCVHPDKVQQKGANIQQKYIAEKVFDLLKEAWNKFNAEELRKQ